MSPVERKLRSLLLQVVDIVLIDARELRHVIVAWWLLLAITGAGYWILLTRGTLPFVSVSFLSDTAAATLIYIGSVLAGVLVLQHPIHADADWRTRPWNRRALWLGKLAGVMVLLWLPAMSLQILVIAWADLGRGQWVSLGFEIFLLVAGPMLASASIASLCASLRQFLFVQVALWVAVQPLLRTATATPASYHRVWGQGLPEAFSPFPPLLVQLVLSTLVLLLAYRFSNRRRAAWIGAALYCIAWFPARSIATSQPRLPGVSPEVSVSVSEASPRSPGPYSQALCLQFEINGIPDVEIGYSSLSTAGHLLEPDIDEPGQQTIDHGFHGWNHSHYERRSQIRNVPLEGYLENKRKPARLRAIMFFDMERGDVLNGGTVELGETVSGHTVTDFLVDDRELRIRIKKPQRLRRELRIHKEYTRDWVSLDFTENDGAPADPRDVLETLELRSNGSSTEGRWIRLPFPGQVIEDLWSDLVLVRETDRELPDNLDVLLRELRWDLGETTILHRERFVETVEVDQLSKLAC